MSPRAPRILWIDAVAGASGDMCLGALVDLGVPVSALKRPLRSLPIRGWSIGARRVRRGSLSVAKVDVRVSTGAPRSAHSGRTWRDVKGIVEAGALDRPVRDRALAIFRRLFEAEAEAHGTAVGRVHLHEAGAVDAIVDIVGTSIGLAHLAPDRIVVSPVTTGHGTVRCSHGVFPVPGPAIIVLLRGVPLSGVEAEGERLTPTGAAILTGIADAWGGLPAARPTRVGYGAGDRDFPERPNALRMVLAEATGARGIPEEARGRALVVTFTVDDATPQLLAFAAERLFEEGALDVYTTPVHMKKGRTGHEITVLARSEDLDRIASTALRHTTTFGLRFRTEGRIELERSLRRVRTPFGSVRVKVGRLDGVEVHAWPEYDDCAALARRRGVPLGAVQHAALAARRRKES